MSATGERDTLDDTQVSLVFCVYSASPWAARVQSLSYGSGKVWSTYLLYKQAIVSSISRRQYVQYGIEGHCSGRDKRINTERKKKYLVEGGKKVGSMGKDGSEVETVEECEEGEG